nr:MAG TPA: hypothetical protein [Caudoviricetes sp.]
MVLVILIVFFVTGIVFFFKGLYIAVKTKCRDIDGMCYCLIGAVFLNATTQILLVVLA